MKMIFKNTKINIYNFGVVIISVLLAGVFMQSCSNEDDYYSDNGNQQLKSLLVSSEYKTLNEDIKDLGVALKSNYSKLSDTEKEKVIDILNEISAKSDSPEELEKLFKEFNSLVNVDLKTKVNKLNKNVIEIKTKNDLNNISKKQLLSELMKSNNSNNNLPRLKNGSESDEEFTRCMDSCAITSTAAMLFCIGPQAAPCVAGVLAVYALCCLLC